MNPRISHPWVLPPRKAMALQIQLSHKVIRKSKINVSDLVTVGGVDTHYRGGLALATVVIIRLPDLKTVACATSIRRVSFPYIPGLLTFREGPAMLDALNNYELIFTSPDPITLLSRPGLFGGYFL